MLLVQTKIGPSKIAGIGLFAAEPITKGTPVWSFTAGLDLKIPKSKLEELPMPVQKSLLNYCSLNPHNGHYILDFDDARFMNHADSPNVAWVYANDPEEGEGVSIRNIAAGEELTVDYRAFDSLERKLDSH